VNSQSPWVIERFGPRGARLALVVSGLLFMGVIGSWSALQVMAVWHRGQALKGALLALLAVVVVLLSLRVLVVNWRATQAADDRPVTIPDGSEQTGIWGVGGPGMREPGSTGAWPRRHVDRRYGDPQE
jgi:hypothetical protein